MQYRPEIDGLRAVAVLPVVFFHAGFQTFSGGFIGVDVFFVISGYLITSIILAELDHGQFSLVRFYERRARRILPALFAVLAACIPAAWLWLLPKDMVDFSKSLAAVPLFSSNLLFWTTSGYFDTSSELKPLLHTWSLAVEEQYYVLFPVFLLLGWRFGKRALVFCLTVFLVLSLGLAEWAALAKPSAAFYLLPFRGWELLVGALVAFYLENSASQRLSIPASNIGSLSGMALIGTAVVFFDHQTAFPGLSATIPTAGAALVIMFASERTLVGRLLSSRPVVGIGLISYSAYLWHQPILVFTRHRSLTEPDAGLLAIQCFALLPLSYLTWRFIEQPFRNKKFLSRRQVFLFGFFGSLFFIVSGLAIVSSQGLLGREERMKNLQTIEGRLNVNQGLSPKCDGAYTEASDCKTSDTPEIMVWGDSFAMHLVDGILASNPQAKIIQNTISGCGPFLDVAPFAPPSYGKTWATDCIAANDRVRDLLIRQPSIRYVILSSPFTRYVATGSRLMTRDGSLVDGPSAARAAFIKTLESIAAMNKTPVVFSPPPHVSFSTGRCLLKADFFSSPRSACDFDLSAALTKQAEEITWLRGVGENHKVVFLNQGTCPDGQRCNASQGTTLIYRDGGHLSHEGSQFIGRRMDFYNLVKGTP